MRRRGILNLLLISILLSTSFNRIEDDDLDSPNTTAPKVDPEYLSIENHWVDSVFNSLNLEEKIAQLMMVAAYSNRGKDHQEEILNLIDQYNIGGLIFFQGGPVRQARQTNRYQSNAKTPLLIAMDAEWGLNMRLDSTIKYPFQMMLGAIQDNQLIYEMGTHLAEQMHRLGIHINFAPVVDVNNNPDNPVINIRSFGENKEKVAQKGLAYMVGLQDNHIITTAKHFPGHGDTDSDSHYTLPVIKHDVDHLTDLEMYPFRELINGGATGVMVAHLNIPSLDPTPNLPSTLSPIIVDGWLRDKLNFNGLVFTDALNMKGASDFFKPGQIEVNAFKAGNDILLMPDDVPLAIKNIKKEIDAGRIAIEELNKRVKKIIAAKYWVNLNNYQPVELENLYEDLNIPKYQILKRKMVKAAITIVENKDRILPLSNLDTLKIASVAIGENSNNHFQKRLDYYSKVDHFVAPKDISVTKFHQLLKELKRYNLILVSISNTDIRVTRDYGLKLKNISLVDSLLKTQKTILNLFGNPYALNYFRQIENAKAVIVGYQDESYIQDLTAQMIFGGFKAGGELPVSTNLFDEGTKLETFGRTRLQYGTCNEAGISPKLQAKIDSIVNDAIDQKATPGCQVLVARNGIVALNKCYGYHTYQKKREVEQFDVYDIASITKIVGTLPFIMKLEEEKSISLKDEIGDHLTYFDTTNKGDLQIGDILTHQAGLKAWIPFYLSTLQSLTPEIELFSGTLDDEHPYKLAKRSYMTKHLIYNDSVYRHIPSYAYNIKVAENMYMNEAFIDTLRNEIATSELRKRKDYKYSDLGFYMFKELVENKYNMPLNQLVTDYLYAKIGANNTCYLPLECFERERIVPTENDVFYRRQLLKGYVHDYGAAMLGGVGGHAGVFSNANDLAKIMLMYLNGGEYGDLHFLKKSTINKFTSSPHVRQSNRRAYGFDKPKLPNHKYGPTCDEASMNSYGHTGFTGTMAWVDPDYDLIYIFLSNRIHPDANNTKLLAMDIRTKIQEAIYENILTD